MPWFSTRGKSQTERFVRMLLLLLVFLGVIWAFWKNYEGYFDQIQAKQSIWDETDELEERDRAYIASFAGFLRENYGMRLRVQIRKGTVEPPELDRRTLFIGLSPSREEAVVVFPPLLRSGLEQGFVEYVQQEHFEPYFSKDQWRDGLRRLLLFLKNQLLDLENQGQEAKSG
jgi:cbb3-type cytochrome oxidase subunit 3